MVGYKIILSARMLNRLQATKGIGVIRSATYELACSKTNNEAVKKLVLEIYLETVK